MDKNFMTVDQVKKTANDIIKKVRDKGYSTEGGGGISQEAFVSAMNTQIQTLKDIAFAAGYSRNQYLQDLVRAGAFSQHYSVGDQLIVKYYGNDMLCDIVAIDVAEPADPSLTHSATLMAHYLLDDDMMFDNKEPSNTDSNRKSYGNNRYKDSNIRLWLNSDGAAGSWWTAQHDADAAPNYATTKAGFMNGFDADFLGVIGETKIKVVKNTVTDGGSYETLVDKFYLPSTTEVGLANENSIAEGALFPYFSSNTQRTKSKSGGSAYGWWLRTPNSSDSSYAHVVGSDGTLSYDDAYRANGVCPVFNII